MINDNTLSWLHQTKEYAKCPFCASGQLDSRIPQTFFYKHLIFWRTYKNYKCNTCGSNKHIAQ